MINMLLTFPLIGRPMYQDVGRSLTAFYVDLNNDAG